MCPPTHTMRQTTVTYGGMAVRRTSATLAAVLLLGFLGSCSNDAGDEPADRSDDVHQADARPPVDLAQVEVSPIPTGGGVPNGSAAAPASTRPLTAGYREDEYLLAGTAAVYAGP